MELARRAVDEVYRDRLRDLAYDTKGSFLEEPDKLNLEVRFRSLMTASVQYTILTRYGLDPMDYLDAEVFCGHFGIFHSRCPASPGQRRQHGFHGGPDGDWNRHQAV